MPGDFFRDLWGVSVPIQPIEGEGEGAKRMDELHCDFNTAAAISSDVRSELRLLWQSDSYSRADTSGEHEGLT